MSPARARGRAVALLAAAACLSLLPIGPAHSQKADSKKAGKEDKQGPPTPITGKADKRFGPVEALMLEVIEKGKVPGGALAVAKDGKLIYSRGFGYADREAKVLMKPESLFRISSLSKPITAVAILQLVENGKLKLDAEVMTVLGLQPPRGVKFDERWKAITIRNLLEHRAGFDPKASDDPLYSSPDVAKEMGGGYPVSAATTIRYMLKRELDFKPGSKMVYANFNYCLLGRVVEKVHRQGYEGYVKQHVFKPLGLTGPRLGKTLYSRRAPGEVKYYSNTTARGVVPPVVGKKVTGPYGLFHLEAMDSCSGWLASPQDLVKFACDFIDPKKSKVLKAGSIEEMFARPEGHKGQSYHAKGWLVQPHDGTRRTYWHDASMEGSSGILVHRFDGITFAVFFNTREKLKPLNGPESEPAHLVEPLLHRALPVILAK
jgi:N-acyl-D-amino-acid deacylase